MRYTDQFIKLKSTHDQLSCSMMCGFNCCCHYGHYYFVYSPCLKIFKISMFAFLKKISFLSFNVQVGLHMILNSLFPVPLTHPGTVFYFAQNKF